MEFFISRLPLQIKIIFSWSFFSLSLSRQSISFTSKTFTHFIVVSHLHVICLRKKSNSIYREQYPIDEAAIDFSRCSKSINLKNNSLCLFNIWEKVLIKHFFSSPRHVIDNQGSLEICIRCHWGEDVLKRQQRCFSLGICKHIQSRSIARSFAFLFLFHFLLIKRLCLKCHVTLTFIWAEKSFGCAQALHKTDMECSSKNARPKGKIFKVWKEWASKERVSERMKSM